MERYMRILVASVFPVVVAALASGAAAPAKLLSAHEYDPAIDPADFEDGRGKPLPIDNPFLPLVPGTIFLYEGVSADGFELNEVRVSGATKNIVGIDCTVVEDRVWFREEASGELVLVEETFDWFAQDRDGNVWYFGENSRSLDDQGNWVNDGSWEAGIDGALPGIVMLASPRVGTSYRQEFYEGVAEDMAKILRLNVPVSVEYGEFEDCLLTKDWSPLAPGAVEHKYYAEGVGLVRVEKARGVFELIEILQE